MTTLRERDTKGRFVKKPANDPICWSWDYLKLKNGWYNIEYFEAWVHDHPNESKHFLFSAGKRIGEPNGGADVMIGRKSADGYQPMYSNGYYQGTKYFQPVPTALE